MPDLPAGASNSRWVSQEEVLANRPSKKRPVRASKGTRVKPRGKKRVAEVAPAAKHRLSVRRQAPAATAPPPVTATAPSAEDSPVDAVLSEAELRKCKSGLSKKDLEHYRQLLLEKRAELLGDVESLQVDVRNNGGNLSNLPLHMADVGSDNYQQEFTLGLVESDRKTLREIDEALVRMERGYYGVCVVTGKPIGRPRLDIKPWAKYCIEVVRERERRGLSV